MRKRLLSGIPLALVLLGAAGWASFRPKPQVTWRTASLDRGEVSRKVTATGTLNALTQISVGTQVSGVVTHLYADFNSVVKRGQVIARIDSAVLETQLAEARAALRKAQSAWDHARADLARNQRLAAENLIAAADLETRSAACEAALGDLEAAKADLDRARINLGYCTITAPVNGVVVSRVVEVGQTVAASFSTPSLFIIAQDLSRMKVQVAIDEADIGQIEQGQEAEFTVDSYPGLRFRGRVREIQLNPTVTSNVVTYVVVLEVANVPRGQARPGAAAPGAGPGAGRGEWALFPGMTANVSILTADRKAVLRAPNLALRFNPGLPGPAGDKLWVLERGAPRAVPVTVAVSGTPYSEVAGPGLREGQAVLVGQDSAQPAAAAAQPLTGPGAGGPPPPGH